MSSTGRRLLAALLVTALVCTGCRSTSKSTSKSTATNQSQQPSSSPDDDNQLMSAAIDDVNAYWQEEFAKLYPGETFHPLDPSRKYPYGPDNPPPSCGAPGKAPYDQVARNAFYCPAGDFVAWDHAALTPVLLNQFGPLTLGVVAAHELGHRTQNEHGILDGRFITFVTEQQADCFAGVWVKRLQDRGSEHFDVTAAALDDAVAGFLQIRDPVGTDPVTNPGAHGSAFQRINAFQDGLTDGPEKCKTYEDGALQKEFVPETFNDLTDLSTRGNLPLEQVEPLVIGNLDGFWSRAARAVGKTWTPPRINPFDPAAGVTCGDRYMKGDAAVGAYLYCAADDTLSWDEVHLMPAVHERIGDMAVGIIIATLFSQRAQQKLELASGTLDANLQTDCFTGVWAGAAKTGELNPSLPPEARLTLSPGDLDEAVAGFLVFSRHGDGSDGTSEVGSAFQRVASFRAGFFETFTGGLSAGMKRCVTGSAG